MQTMQRMHLTFLPLLSFCILFIYLLVLHCLEVCVLLTFLKKDLLLILFWCLSIDLTYCPLLPQRIEEIIIWFLGEVIWLCCLLRFSAFFMFDSFSFTLKETSNFMSLCIHYHMPYFLRVNNEIMQTPRMIPEKLN